VIDADLQHPPDVTLALYRVIERGADIAVASRHLEGGGVSDWSVARRIVSRAAQLIGLLILPGVVGRVGEVPYVFQERTRGGSKATARVYLEYLRHLLRLRLSDLPVNRFIRFAAVGLSGVIVDMGLLFLLSDPTML